MDSSLSDIKYIAVYDAYGEIINDEKVKQLNDVYDKIISYIKVLNHVTYAEITVIMQAHNLTTHGELLLTAKNLSMNNIWMWGGASPELSYIHDRLLKDDRVVVHETLSHPYLKDNKGLDLPIAKRLNYEYKKPHWIPVCFCSKDCKLVCSCEKIF